MHITVIAASLFLEKPKPGLRSSHFFHYMLAKGLVHQIEIKEDGSSPTHATII